MKKREKIKQKFLVLISLLVGIFVPGTSAEAARQRLVIRPYQNVTEVFTETMAENTDHKTDGKETDKIVSISRNGTASSVEEAASSKENENRTENINVDQKTVKENRRKRLGRKLKAAFSSLKNRKLIVKFRRGAGVIPGKMRKIFHRPRKAVA
ncbi:putative uncharacterized protein [Blautia hydrogenotrophica CAG:147]|uniref:hypothetical protein n=1 Tax=Blautia hydrogenotrophica TaxID=53443 RepID=UPI000336CFDB|nr:hypothetical protein [Blautia hydrogenotrophica]CCX58650.1 putative uncharacterized protein [Blautia hydrogenotrophica CAG:147]